jgi:hypothetical protein
MCHVVIFSRLTYLDVIGRTSAADILEPEFNMDLPEPSSFIDIHCGHKISNLPLSRIEDYMQACGKQFDNKFKELYQQRY